MIPERAYKSSKLGEAIGILSDSGIQGHQTIDGTQHSLRRITERGERRLRVIGNVSMQPSRAITGFFDWRLRDQTCGCKVDKASDALYFRLDESAIVDSEEVQPGVILDFNECGQVAGVEFLGIYARTTEPELTSKSSQGC
jgi:uncharacterized protein YuzE